MPLAPTINEIAGSRHPYLRFLLYDLVGQFFWVLLYGGLGYLFPSQWERVGHALYIFSGLSFGLFFLVQSACPGGTPHEP